ncbi:hypothetical protein [Agreia sp. COWG]|uniref:hypothetical protein n=1 Tax=Agreia sp. COWG TaxID=2773266 RepID=UPI001F299321|nr:hypothetical protein [Agreia sp. COWG]
MNTETTRRKNAAGADPSPVVTLPAAAPPATDAPAFESIDAEKELLDNLRLVKLAMEAAAVSDPLKCAQLSKRRSELLNELTQLGMVRASAAKPAKEDPFDAFLGGGNVSRMPAAPSRKSS